MPLQMRNLRAQGDRYSRWREQRNYREIKGDQRDCVCFASTWKGRQSSGECWRFDWVEGFNKVEGCLYLSNCVESVVCSEVEPFI